MNLNAVLLAAANKIEAGEAHFTCTAIAMVINPEWHLGHLDTMVTPEVQRYLELATGREPGSPGHHRSYDIMCAELMNRFQNEAKELAGEKATEKQLQEIQARLRAKFLRDVAAKVNEGQG